MKRFCLLHAPESYVPCSSDLLVDAEARQYWLDHFAGHFHETLKHAAVQYGRTARKRIETCREAFDRQITALRNASDALGPQLDILTLDRLRGGLLRQHDLKDPFAYIKARENAQACSLFPAVARALHARTGRDKWLGLIESVFAGNIFDMGASATMHLTAESTDFLDTVEKTKPRPWLVDDFDRLSEDLPDGPPSQWSKAVVFCDNAGSDFVLGLMPLVRALALCGTQIVLAANEYPSLNDMTAAETVVVLQQLAGLDEDLAALIRAGMFEVVSTGNDAPLIDLSKVSEELNEAASDADLVILEGMGRGVESNFQAEFSVDTMWLATLKDKHVASQLGGGLFDCVCKYVPKDDKP